MAEVLVPRSRAVLVHDRETVDDTESVDTYVLPEGTTNVCIKPEFVASSTQWVRWRIVWLLRDGVTRLIDQARPVNFGITGDLTGPGTTEHGFHLVYEVPAGVQQLKLIYRNAFDTAGVSLFLVAA